MAKIADQYASDVVIPEMTSSFDIEASKDLQTKEIESEQQLTERALKVDANNPGFPAIRQHFEELIDQYKDVRSLVDVSMPAEDFMVEVRTKAAVADELTRLLHMIDQVNRAEEEDERE